MPGPFFKQEASQTEARVRPGSGGRDSARHAHLDLHALSSCRRTALLYSARYIGYFGSVKRKATARRDQKQFADLLR